MGGIFGGGSSTMPSSTVTPESALSVNTSSAGVGIAKLYGTQRIGSNMIGCYDFTAVAQTQTSSGGGGGKGGGGGSQTTTTGYKYYATLLLALGAGPINAVLTVWDGKNNLGGLSAIGASLFTGALGQQPWPYLSSSHSNEALGYSALSYVAGASMYLGESNSMPGWTFEGQGAFALSSGGDANPGAIIADLLADPFIGPGFSSGLIGDFSVYEAWCGNLGLTMSVLVSGQQAVRDYLNTWLDATQADPYWSQGKLQIKPRGDAYPSAYTGSLTPVLSFSNGDYFPADGEPPVKVTRADPSDLYNSFTVEYANRADSYNANTAVSDDGAHIGTFGLRSEGSQSWHFFTNATAAQIAVDLRRNYTLGVGATYVFTVGEIGALLEQTDIVTISESGIGLSNYPVEITLLEEADDGKTTITARDIPGEMAYVVSRPLAIISGYSGGYGTDPGNINAPLIFEPPLSLAGDLQVWIGASSASGNWGGCHVWISSDGDSYQRLGTIQAPARQGVLTGALTSGVTRDSVNTLSVSLAESNGELSSVSAVDFNNFATLSYVDGELLGYQTAALTGSNAYNLTTLYRGLYGSAIAAHAKGSVFCRLDDALFKLHVSADEIGNAYRLKFTSFNIYGGGEQDLADVMEYHFLFAGSALTLQLPDIGNLSTAYISDILQLSWDATTDSRSPDVEIRMGQTWKSAQVVGRVSGTHAATRGDGTYWLAWHYTVGSGSTAIELYSENPVSIVIAGSQLVSNVIQSWDEAALGWPGTCSGLVVNGSSLELCGAGDIRSPANMLTVSDVIGFGGLVNSGTYQVPISHRVNIGRVAACQVAMTVSVVGDSIYDNVLTVTDVEALSDVTGQNYGPSVLAISQVRLSQDGVTWGDWQNWVAGKFKAMAYDFRLLVSSTGDDITALVKGFSYLVDVPDRADTYTVTSLAAGASVAFAPSFNGGPGAGNLPVVSAAIVANGSASDTVQITGLSLNGCTVIVYNASGIATAGRTVHLIVQGY